ncbi:MAG: hypothetical protein QW837_07175 [Conexivisphaerales archaeon]
MEIHTTIITKQGSPYLRWALNQVTWAHIRNEPDGTVAKFYRKLAKKKASAVVAASAKLLKINNILGTEGATAL